MTELMQRTSVRVATVINRRRFLRRAATVSFTGLATMAAGGWLRPSQAFAYSENCEPVSGPGCPKGCGPDPCCAGLGGGCGCSNGNGGCNNNGSTCLGLDGDWYGQSCWTCSYYWCGPCYYKTVTTCCDCKTTCGDGICIAYSSTTTLISHTCGGHTCASDLPVGTVVGVGTGNPQTSWGMQPTLAPITAASAPTTTSTSGS